MVKLRLLFVIWTLLLCVLIPLAAHGTTIEQYDNDYNSLSVEQQEFIQWVYDFGKPYNLQWTLAAKVWEESQCGLQVISERTHPVYGKDYGITQINIHWLLVAHNLPDTPFNRSKYATKLVRDDVYCLLETINNIRHWECLKKSWQSYRFVWAHYNGGTTPNWDYAERIAKRIRVLTKYIME